MKWKDKCSVWQLKGKDMMTREQVWEFKIFECRSFRYNEDYDISKRVDGCGEVEM